MTETLLVGIAGYGVVGKRRRHFIDQRTDMRTVAVCDRQFSGEGTLNDGTPYYRHYQDLLRHRLDALFVCLTNDVAAEVTIAGLRQVSMYSVKNPRAGILKKSLQFRHASGHIEPQASMASIISTITQSATRFLSSLRETWGKLLICEAYMENLKLSVSNQIGERNEL